MYYNRSNFVRHNFVRSFFVQLPIIINFVVETNIPLFIASFIRASHCSNLSFSLFLHYNNNLMGFSKTSLKAWSHSAPTAPSITRWSHERVTVRMVATSVLLSPSFTLLPSIGTNLWEAPPTARMAAWGGLITAEKCLIPNIPKLEMVNVPPISHH